MNQENINIPNHVAIIMDGNGRWATKRGLNRSMGHLEGSKTLEKLGTYILKKGVKVLSVFAFSTENFKRSDEEVDYLMNLFIDMFTKKCKRFKKEGIKVIFSGREIIDASKKIAEDYKKGILDLDSLNKETFAKYLYNDLPPIDLLIRTSGELRISNFMLYQMAYSEMTFPNILFPDFKEKEFDIALEEYQKRNRRFGGN